MTPTVATHSATGFGASCNTCGSDDQDDYYNYTTVHDYRIERCSGHAWSRDGIAWSYAQEEQPFNCEPHFPHLNLRSESLSFLFHSRSRIV